MVGRRDVGSWLEGPGGTGPAQDHPGQRLGRPAEGAGSVASFGRRLVALVVDWAACVLIAQGLLSDVGPRELMALVVLLAENVLLVGTAGCTLGHRLLGLRVETVAGTAPGLGRAAVRSLLLVLAVPPLIWDADQRGLHDKAAGTLVARSR
jgi:uncharacterized RDD family membrane protein YckC